MLSACTLGSLSEASVANGFCAGLIPLAVQQPRSIIALGLSDFVTVERGTGSILIGEDTNGDGIPETLRTLQGDRSVPFGHQTRTLAIKEGSNELYVAVGSNENVDRDSFRARIRRFKIDDPTLFPLDFIQGEVFADGLRNEVALDFAPDGTLWGVGNSADTLFRAELGGDIHNDNPAEEVHRFGTAGLNFGYPYCWREYNMLLGQGRGTAWAWPDPLGNKLSKSVSDEQCRSDYNTPVLALQAHSAPLGITFYEYNATRPAQCNGVTPFPLEMNGFAFVAYHGSWNRPVPTGFKVVYFPLTKDGLGVVGGISATPQDLLVHEGLSAKWSDGFRPVDVSFDACGRLLVSSDGSRSVSGQWAGDKIIRIESTVKSLPPSPVPTPETLGNGLIVAFFAGLWARVRKWLGLYK